MSFYDALENARLRDKNAAMIRELDALRVELAEVRARAERLGSMLDLANSAMAAVNEVARKALNERDAALARAADSDARLVRAIDAAKAAALAALAAPGPAAAAEAIFGFTVDIRDAERSDDDFDLQAGGTFADNGDDCPDDCPLCTEFAARKGRTTPSVRR